MLNLVRQVRAVPAAALPLLVYTLLVSGPRIAGAAPTDNGAASAKDAFQQVEVDLSAGIVKQVLPFDVPFLIHAPVTDDIQSVCATYDEAPSSTTDCRATEASADEQKADCTQEPGQQICRQGKIAPWRRKPGISATEFFLLVPALEADRRYCFKLAIARTVSAVQLATFRNQAHAAIDLALRSPGRISGLSVEDAEKLHKKLIAAVLPPDSRDTISAPKGSIFDPCAKGQDVTGRFNQGLANVFGLQNHRQERLAAYCGYQSRLVSDAKDLSPKVQALFTRLRKAARDEAVAQALGPHDQTLAATSFPAGDTDCPGDFFTSWMTRVWKSTDLDSKVQATASLRTALDDTGKALAAALSISSAAGLTPVEIESAAKALKQAQDDAHHAAVELEKASTSLDQRDKAIDAFVAELGGMLQGPDILIQGTSVADFATRSTWYISADLGVGVAPEISRAFSYVGVNLYFRPVNKQAPLRTLKGNTFLRRFSVMLGLTVQDLSEAGRRDNLFGSQMGVAGAGIRILDSVRVSAGALVFRKFDPNPLIDHKTLAATYFASVSIDWDVKDTVTSLGAAIGVK